MEDREREREREKEKERKREREREKERERERERKKEIRQKSNPQTKKIELARPVQNNNDIAGADLKALDACLY